MSHLHLDLFPAGSAAEAVVTCVWIGVLVASLTNLRFGWTYSGLAAPGYVVPLMLVRPWTAAVILVEAALTYLIVYALSEKLPRGRVWSSFFGRDRFFAILVTSVAVRVVVDGWLLPIVGLFMVDHLGLAFDYRDDLQSFGLIIVALVANLFWKPGLIRGVGPFAFNLTVTFFIVRVLLMEFTNFNLGSIQFMYEDIAASLLASPKAYIVLLTTGAIASHLNLRYAWEYAGILLPALLALQWYEPVKVLATVIEVVVVYWVGSWALKLPWIRVQTMEGSRKLLLFFTVAFIYRLAIGFAIPRVAPSFRVSDFYGFGYLLSTLLAVKAQQKTILPRLLRATIQVSLMGAVAANILGLVLLSLPDKQAPGTLIAAAAVDPIPEPGVTADRLLLHHRLDIDRVIDEERVEMPTPAQYSLLDEAFKRLRLAIDSGSTEDLGAAASRFALLEMDLHTVAGDLLVVEERVPRGWGLFIFDSAHADGPVLEVPSPESEPDALAAAMDLFNGLGAAALAVAGAPTEGEIGVNPLLTAGTPLHAFHRRFGLGRTVQIRALEPGRADGPVPQSEATGSVLYVDRRLPKGLDLDALEELVSPITVHWQPWQERNAQRRMGRGGFAELLLAGRPVPDLRRRRADRLLGEAESSGRPLAESVRDFDSWIAQRQLQALAPGSETYSAPQRHELLFVDREILQPMLAAAGVGEGPGGASEPGRILGVTEAAIAAESLGLKVARLEDAGGVEALLLWHEGTDGHPPGWGGLAISTNPGTSFVFEAPHPRSSDTTLRVAAELFQQLGAEALIFSGAHPHANLDGGADVLDRRNKVSFFTAAHQAVLRESRDRPLAVVQVRSHGEHGPAFLATSRGPLVDAQVEPAFQLLDERLAASGTSLEWVHGQRNSAGLEVGNSFHAEYLRQTSGEKLFALLWLSLSRAHSSATPGRLDELLTALDVPEDHRSLVGWLEAFPGQVQEPPAALRIGISHAAATTDLVALAATLARYGGFAFSTAVSEEGLGTFLAVKPDTGAPWMLRLGARETDTAVQKIAISDADAVALALANPAGWLWFGEDPASNGGGS